MYHDKQNTSETQAEVKTIKVGQIIKREEQEKQSSSVDKTESGNKYTDEKSRSKDRETDQTRCAKVTEVKG